MRSYFLKVTTQNADQRSVSDRIVHYELRASGLSEGLGQERRRSRRGLSSGIFRVTIIDWDSAGFCPEWWEFADAPVWWGSTPAWWVESIDKIMPTYVSERWVYDFYWRMIVR